MCGIAALFAPRRLALDGPIRQMTTVVRHRGPDDEGFVFFSGDAAAAFGGPDTPDHIYSARLPYSPSTSARIAEATIALGHRRLAIVDLSPGGHQPMCTPDGDCWIVYNGEVYNHLELRDELIALGHVFGSRSDTEVILQAYKRWGAQCVERFNGMFAFIIVDRRAQRVFAARDRFGVKPLYLWRSPGGLIALASEIKQFSVLPGWSARLNRRRAYDFLNWGVLDHTEETLFDGVRQVRGGECIDISIDDLQRTAPVRRWYSLTSRPFSGDLKLAADQFLGLFTDAVRMRLRADVEVGSCLSGGLDSSSIVCVANQLLRSTDRASQQHTFSSCAELQQFDERRYIDIVVDHTGVRPHYVYPALDGLFEAMDAVTWHQDEPFGSTSVYAQWHVFRLAGAAGVKVLLDGQGADELLAGYHSFFAPHFGGLFVRLRWHELFRELFSARKLHGMTAMGAAAHLAHALVPERLRQAAKRVASHGGRGPAWLNAGRLGVGSHDSTPLYGFNTTSLNSMSYSLLTSASVPMLLHWEDRDSMAHSTESRLPFLDFRIAEFLMGLPPNMKLSDATTKRVLREAMTGIIPEPIRVRMDKMGFVTPEEVWLRKEAPDLFRAELRKSIAASQGVINDSALDSLERVISGKDTFSFSVWRMISFGRWMERFQVALSA